MIFRKQNVRLCFLGCFITTLSFLAVEQITEADDKVLFDSDNLYSPVKHRYIPVDVLSASKRKILGGCEAWLDEYADWHARELQLLRAGKPVKTLIYTCANHEPCGGIGDRISGMLSAFYIAVASRRLFLIDHLSPFSLSQTLVPSLIDWDNVNLVDDTLSTTTVYLVDTANPIESFADIFDAHDTGVDVLRLKVNRYYAGMTLWTPQISGIYPGETKFRRIGALYNMRRESCISAEVKYFSQLATRQTFHLAFWSLFEFSYAVKQRSTEMLRQVGVQTSSKSEYIAVHARIGGSNPDSIGVAGWDDPERHSQKDLGNFMSCARQKMFGSIVPPRVFKPPLELVLVFSDSTYFKEQAQHADPHFKFIPSTTLFHVDRSKTSNESVLEAGNLDAYAELSLLSEASCIVGSLSTFSGVAASMSRDGNGDNRCFCIFDSCSNDNYDFFEQTERARVSFIQPP